jgi:hypothetical protein
MVKLRLPDGVHPSHIISITPPTVGKLRARKVVTRSRARSTGKYPSWKMARMIQYESQAELNAFRLADANPLIKTFREQPAIIRFLLDGEVYEHYPDAFVETSSGNEYWEIKSEEQARRPDIIRRTTFLIHALPNAGYGGYRLILAENLARQPQLDNALTMLKWGRSPVTQVEREYIRRLLDEGRQLTWKCISYGEIEGVTRPVICRLFLEGTITFPIDECLLNDTLFRWVNTATTIF